MYKQSYLGARLAVMVGYALAAFRDSSPERQVQLQAKRGFEKSTRGWEWRHGIPGAPGGCVTNKMSVATGKRRALKRRNRLRHKARLQRKGGSR